MKPIRHIAAVLLTMSLVTACGGGSAESPAAPEPEAVESEAPEESAPAAPESREEAPEAEEPAETDGVMFGEKVLVDEAGIRITAREFVTEEFGDDGIRLLIENENPSACLIECPLLSVNGYELSGSFSAEVAAGKKLNTVLEIPEHALRAAEITEIHMISAAFAGYDPEPWSTVLEPEEKVIFDDGTKVQDLENPGTEVFNEEGVRVSARMVRNDPFWGTGIILFLENESKNRIYAEAKNLSVDGYMLEGYYGTILWPGKRAVGKIYLLDSDLADNGITEPEEAELYVGLCSAETMEDIVSGIGSFPAG